MGQLEWCKKIPNFFFQGLGEVCLEARRPNGPGSIEKLKVSYQVWSHEASTFKKNETKNRHFPRPAETDPYVLQVCLIGIGELVGSSSEATGLKVAWAR